MHVRADGARRFPVEVEAAVYFSCLEGLQNVAKYAQATRHVTLARRTATSSSRSRMTGGASTSRPTYGTGLQGMADRLAALDGELTISSEPGAGTRVRGRIEVGT